MAASPRRPKAGRHFDLWGTLVMLVRALAAAPERREALPVALVVREPESGVRYGRARSRLAAGRRRDSFRQSG
jgi:hypothetical protein